MVRLKPGQTIETELDGIWIQATVEQVDASLALIHLSDTHSEWIYRGSTRLEPLFTDMVSARHILLIGMVLLLIVVTLELLIHDTLITASDHITPSSLDSAFLHVAASRQTQSAGRSGVQ